MLFDDIERAEKLTDKMLAVAEKENLSIEETRLAIEDLQLKFDVFVAQYHKKIRFGNEFAILDVELDAVQ